MGTVRQSQYASVAQKAITADNAIKANTANTAVSSSYSSYAVTASLLLGSIESASYAATASYLKGSITSASYAATASVLLGSIQSASFAATASYIPNYVLNSATSSFVVNSQTSSFVRNSQTSSMTVATASYYGGSVTSASYTSTASIATSASYSTTSSTTISASYAINATTASVLDLYGITSATNSYLLFSNIIAATGQIVGGNNNIRYNSSTNILSVGNISATTLTGSLQGTASYASQALSASYIVTAQTASYVLQAVSASFATLAQTSNTASYVAISQTSSYAATSSYSTTLGASIVNEDVGMKLVNSAGSTISSITSLTASLASTASYVLNGVSSSYAATASLALNYVLNSATSSFVTNSQTSSFVQNSQTSSFVLNSQTGSMTVGTASLALRTSGSLTGSLLGTSSWATNALTSSYVTNLNQNIIITGSLTVSGSITSTGTTTLGNGTFTKAGYNTGDILLDNNGTDTPGILFYYANNSNYGVDSWSGSYDVLSGQIFRVTNKLNETGGAVKLAIDTTGNAVFSGFVKANAWRAGQVINDIVLSNTEVTISTTTIATSNTDTDFLTYSYTPLSSNSYLVIHYHLADYSFASGTGNDSYFSRIKIDGNEITYSKQSTVNGNRSGVLFPLTGRYTNSNTTAKSVVVACRRDSADDSITIVNTATSMWLRITEIAR